MKIRFLKDAVGRRAGTVEEQDYDLSLLWIKEGWCEQVKDAPAPKPQTASMDTPPVDRVMTRERTRRK